MSTYLCPIPDLGDRTRRNHWPERAWTVAAGAVCLVVRCAPCLCAVELPFWTKEPYGTPQYPAGVH